LHDEVAEKEEVKEMEDQRQPYGPTANLKGFEKQLSSARINISPSKASSSHVINPAFAAAVQRVKGLLDQKIQSQKQEPMHSAVIAVLEAYV
jgi:hypothetical protein